ncbi:unnamed protein product, partial [Arabidopsis halleri]
MGRRETQHSFYKESVAYVLFWFIFLSFQPIPLKLCTLYSFPRIMCIPLLRW